MRLHWSSVDSTTVEEEARASYCWNLDPPHRLSPEHHRLISVLHFNISIPSIPQLNGPSRRPQSTYLRVLFVFADKFWPTILLPNTVWHSRSQNWLPQTQSTPEMKTGYTKRVNKVAFELQECQGHISQVSTILMNGWVKDKAGQGLDLGLIIKDWEVIIITTVIIRGHSNTGIILIIHMNSLF